MLPGIFNTPVTVERRTSTGRDSLNNPTYGTPVSGSGWAVVYTGVMMRLAFSSNKLLYAQTGERPTPAGIAYYGPAYDIKIEDRIIDANNVQYVVASVVPGYINNTVIDHYEAVLELP